MVECRRRRAVVGGSKLCRAGTGGRAAGGTWLGEGTVAVPTLRGLVLPGVVQVEGVEDDAEGAGGHGGGGEHGVEVAGGGDGDEDGVVGEGPEQADADATHGGAAEADRAREGG